MPTTHHFQWYCFGELGMARHGSEVQRDEEHDDTRTPLPT